MNLLKMAWCSIWRNPRRSVVTMLAMTLTFTVLLLYSGLVEGYLRGMERNVLEMEVGEVQVHAAGYLDKPSKYTVIADADAVLEKLDAAGLPATQRLTAGALVGGPETSAGASLRGVDVARDAQVFAIHQAVAQGRWLDADDPGGVVVGYRLARVLGVTPGDELVIMSQAMDGSMADDLLVVRGVLQSVADATDRSAVFMTEARFRELMVFPKGAHQIVVRVPEGRTLGAVTDEVRALAPELDVRSWRELMPTIAQMLDSSRAMIGFIFLVVYLAVGILILNAMLMAVFERIREFGVFKAIGGSPLHVVGMIFCETAIQLGVALTVGFMIGIPCMWYLTTAGLDLGSLGGMSIAGVAMEPIWRGVYTRETMSAPVVMLVVIALLAVVYPALKAARIQPVEAMRHR